MTTDAINTTGSLFQIYDELIVNIGPENGSEPGDPDTFENVYCTRVVQSAGGSRMDFAELVYAVTDHLQDREQPNGFARRVHVRMPDTDRTLLADGDYVSESVGIGKEGEALTARVETRSWYFGHPVRGYRTKSADSIRDIEDHIVFNPSIDNRTLNNMSFSKQGDTPRGERWQYWLHPEQCMTSNSRTYHDDVELPWTLAEAVFSLCWLLNPDEEFIQNPTYDALDTVFGWDGEKYASPELKAVTIPLGTYLPQALDMLLIPLGYSWYIDRVLVKPTITIFKLGEGAEKTLFLQRPGETLDLEWSNINEIRVDNAIGNSFNQVRVFGERKEIEATFPLFAAWKAEHDTVARTDLNKNASGYVGKETVWRLWIANEAGDLDPAVSRLGQLPVVPEFTTVNTSGRLDTIDGWSQHRRTLGEPLTYAIGDDGEKQRRPVFVQYSVNGGTTWQAVPDEWSIKLCPDQIGILFDNLDVPSELYNAGSQARVRVTGTVFADERVEGYAGREGWAVNRREVELVLFRPDKFQHRWRQSGAYGSVLTGSADVVDHRNAADRFAEQIRDQNHYAEVDCEFRLPGWHLEYKIGDLISKIEGREINLDGAPANAPVYRFPQIVERRFEMTANGPSTVLIVDRGVQQS